MRLRFAKTVRISIDGNAHFCRGLLRHPLRRRRRTAGSTTRSPTRPERHTSMTARATTRPRRAILIP